MTSAESAVATTVSPSTANGARSNCPVLWITGLPGVGKTTLANELIGRLLLRGRAVRLLDGDSVRHQLDGPIDRQSHDRASRLRRAWRLAEMAHALALRSTPVVVATISLFHDVQRWNRRHHARFGEVLLRAPVAELRRRFPQRYDELAWAPPQTLWGVTLQPEYPVDAELELDQEFTSLDLDRHAADVEALWYAIEQGRTNDR